MMLNMLACSSVGNGRKTRPPPLQCPAPFATQQARDVTVFKNCKGWKRGRAAETRQAPKKKRMIGRYHPHRSHIQNKNSPSLHSLFHRALSAQTPEGHPGQHRTGKHLLKSRANITTAWPHLQLNWKSLG